MLTGTLIIEVFANLFEKQSIEILQNSLYQILISVSDNFYFDYRRFAFISAELIWIIPLKIFSRNDSIYKSLVNNLNRNFSEWEFTITYNIHETGG